MTPCPFLHLQVHSARALLLAAGLVLVGLGPAAHAQLATSTSFVLSQDVVDSASGETMISTSYVHDGSVAQPATVGNTSSTTWIVESGFWTGLSTRRVIVIEGTGSGNGSVAGVGIACDLDSGVASGDCSESYLDGEMVDFVASPDPTHAFDAWTGCDTTSTTTLTNDTCEVTVGNGRTVTAQFTALGTVSGRVWRDVDGAGDQDPTEPGFFGVGVSLTNHDGTTLQTTTAGDGTYGFVDLYPDDYDVEIDALTLPPGVVPSYDLDGIATPHVAGFAIDDGEDQTNVDFGYQPQTNLMIAKVDDVDPLPGGQNLTYTITVQNLGPGVATEVTVSDAIPAGTTLVESAGCAEDPLAVPTCTLGVLDVGNSASYTLEVSIDPAPPGSITNTATVTSLEVDLDGSDNTDSETTTLDDDPPAVASLDTLPTTADGALIACETVYAQPTNAIEITFDEPMKDPAGHSTPGDVTNPASYQLVTAGNDVELQTTACGRAAGDDQIVAIASVSYDEPSRTATLEPAVSLGSSLVRIFACGDGPDALTDLGGTPLDGDDDGFSGGDFDLRFRTDPLNFLANGHLDCDLGGWTQSPSGTGEITHVPLDLDGSADSGSARLEDLGGGPDFSLSQCVTLAAYERLELGAWIQLDVDAVGAGLELACTFFDGTGCTGTASAPSVAASLVEDTAGQWTGFYFPMEPPVGSLSARCKAELTVVGGNSFTAHLDRLQLTPADLSLFADGFESGNTSAWTSSNP